FDAKGQLDRLVPHRSLRGLRTVLSTTEQLQLCTGVVNDNVGIPEHLHRVDVMRYLGRQGHFAMIRVGRRWIEFYPSGSRNVDFDPAMGVRFSNDVVVTDRVVLTHQESVDQTRRNSSGAQQYRHS